MEVYGELIRTLRIIHYTVGGWLLRVSVKQPSLDIHNYYVPIN